MSQTSASSYRQCRQCHQYHTCRHWFRTFLVITSLISLKPEQLNLEKEEYTGLLTCFTLGQLVNHLDLQARPVLLTIEALRSATITFRNAELHLLA